MKILYSAIDQTVPGTKGGSVHVRAVAEGLAAIGHEVHVLVRRGGPHGASRQVHWVDMSPPLGVQQLRWMRTGAVRRIARRIEPDVIIERYYNFGGEAILNARAVGARAVLEVNAPVVDHPGSGKARLDRALLVRPMQRWREHLCAAADVIVTPDPGILPPATPREKIAVLEWGADTTRFTPGATGTLPFVPPEGIVAVFAGAFRNWHGAVHLARAIRRLHESGHHQTGALFIGDGPELPNVRAEAVNLPNVVFTGALPHDLMPAALAACHIGVAPFDVAAHKPLALGFYWSPLKMFEYMATGLPVVAPNLPRIAGLVGDGVEGVLYDPSVSSGLVHAIEHLTRDTALRERLGAAARQRAVREYSWHAHCVALARHFER